MSVFFVGYLMRRAIIAVVLLVLAGCAWNPVLDPYPFQVGSAGPDSVATIWGSADDTSMYFRKVNGKGLPSRKAAGYPLSLSFLPGRYEIEVYFLNADHRDAIFPVTVTVKAGHTYVLEYEVTGDLAHGRVGMRLKDLGNDVRCHYDRYNKIRGSAKLVCQ